MSSRMVLEDVVFSDETPVEIQQFTTYCFRKNGSLPKRKGRTKAVGLLKTVGRELSDNLYITA